MSTNNTWVDASLGATGGWTSPTTYVPTRIGKRRIPVYAPKGFSWTPPINIWRDENGVIHTDFDVSIYQPSGKTYYVDVNNGVDTNDGLALATAFKTIKKAVDMPDVVVVMVAKGIYDRPSAFANTAVTKAGPLAIKAIPGHSVRVVNCSPQTWVRHSTYTNLYSTAATPVGSVYDDKYHDEFDDMMQYTAASTAQEANSRPGTYWISAGTVFVHPVDERDLAVNGVDIKVMKDQLSAQFNDGTFYFEGISFEGGNNGACHIAKVATAPKAYFKSCKFKYSINDATSWGGLTIQGASEVFSQACEAARNYNDGFNYHIKLGTIPNAIEVNCIGRHNGNVSDTDNGSTQHDGGKIVRVLSDYFGNVGSNVGDINPGTQSWNVGVNSHDSKAQIQSRYNADFTAHSDAEMWLDTCYTGGSKNSITAQNNAKVYVRASYQTGGGETFEGTGKIMDY